MFVTMNLRPVKDHSSQTLLKFLTGTERMFTVSPDVFPGFIHKA